MQIECLTAERGFVFLECDKGSPDEFFLINQVPTNPSLRVRMKVGPWLTTMTLMSLCLGCTSLLAEEKWIVLFDGKSKDAWRGYQRKDFPDKGWVIDQ